MTANQMNILLVTHGDTLNATRLRTLLSSASRQTWRISNTIIDTTDPGREALLAAYVPCINAGVCDELWVCDNLNYGLEQEIVHPPAFGATRSFAVQYLDGVNSPNGRHNNSHMFCHRVESQLATAFWLPSLGISWNQYGMGYRAYKILACRLIQDYGPTATTLQITLPMLGEPIPYYLALSGYDANSALSRPFEIIRVMNATASALTGTATLQVERSQLGAAARSLFATDIIERVPTIQSDWDRFTASAAQPGVAVAGFGNAHTAPNATPEANGWDYDWGDGALTHPNQPEPAVLSSLPAWTNYPNPTGAMTQLVDRNTWGIGLYGETFQEGPYQEGGQRWWLRNLPRKSGTHEWNGIQIRNNWWAYIANTF